MIHTNMISTVPLTGLRTVAPTTAPIARYVTANISVPAATRAGTSMPVRTAKPAMVAALASIARSCPASRRAVTIVATRIPAITTRRSVGECGTVIAHRPHAAAWASRRLEHVD